MRIPVIAATLLALAALPASAQSITAPDLSAVRSELRKVLMAQETHYSNLGRYTPDLGPLNLATTDSIVIKVVDASPNAYSVSGSVKGKTGASCVLFVGHVAAMPKTEGGRVAKAEGAVVCDGDPE